MQEIYIEDLKQLLVNKKKLENVLGITITNRGKTIFLKGETNNEYTAITVLEALNLGFSVPKALRLTEEDTLLQRVDIKGLTKRKDLERVRSRIIGTHGKTLKTLNTLSDCEFAIHNNSIGIIGPAEDVADAVQSVTSLIQGSKQGNVYARLEREKKKRKKDALDIKNELR